MTAEGRKSDLPVWDKVWREYEAGLRFNEQINLNDTVEVNENFFIGKQWEGVESNGLPTPVFNFLKRVTLFQVASITSDNIKMQASPLSAYPDRKESQNKADIVNRVFAALFERNKIPTLVREYLRNAAVDGDCATYTYFDPDIETGETEKGDVVTEIVENNRIFFGNPNDRRVQKQPYIIIARRMMLKEARRQAKENGMETAEDIRPDQDELGNHMEQLTSEPRVTVLLKLWRDHKTKTIHAVETVRGGVLREEWDMDLTLYPVTWLSWDYVQNCYHGQALITGLVPNQIFINKLFAMSMISLMTTAFPKIIYDRTRISKWDNRVGACIGVNGGDMNSIAKIIDPAQISPQIAQFIQLAVDYTQTFLGATSAAMGDTRPDNTSAIIALQRAAAIPSEITKQNLYHSVEDLGRIYLDFMTANYGKRHVEIPVPEKLAEFTDMEPGALMAVPFDFASLKDTPMSLQLDVGASSYWSEIASMQTLDNLLQQGKIELEDYLERVPDGYITKKQELVEKLKKLRSMMTQMQPQQPTVPGGGAGQMDQQEIPVPQGGGYSALQRKVNETGMVP